MQMKHLYQFLFDLVLYDFVSMYIWNKLYNFDKHWYD